MRDNDSLILESLYSSILLKESSDDEYLRLAENTEKNKKELQRMVDEAAKMAGYDIGPVFRGSRKGRGINATKGMKWFTDFEGEAEGFGKSGQVERVYLKGELQEGNFQQVAIHPETIIQQGAILTREVPAMLTPRQKAEGKTGRPKRRHFAVANPSQIKSADPVTYDDGGNIIPLSQRFDSSSDDIRY